VPLVVMALLGGAIADRMDRRRLLLLDQIGLVVIASALAAVSFAGAPAVPVLYLLGALMAGFSAVQNVARSAIVPNLVAPSQLRGALALNFGLPADDGSGPGARRRADCGPRSRGRLRWWR